MDQHNLEVNYKNDQHNIDSNQEHYREEQRKQNENIYRQRDDLRDYLKYDDSLRSLSGISRMKNGEQLLKTRGVSLLSMKTATERIYHKDKKDYVARSTAAKHAMKQAYRTVHEENLSDSKADLAYEYKQLLENCRVFDNEVRETVEETLAQHPDLLANYEGGNIQKRIETLSRLVTAFLPEREFHFNPPSGDQKSLVKKYLKDFKSNPVNAIKKMQQSLRGERMHRDLMDASSGMKNFRMLYTDMRKRESLAAVFPHISGNAAENFEVRKMNEGVEARKIMIKDLFLMNGMVFDESKDLEFNKEWENTKTLAGQTNAQKKAKREEQSRSGYTLSDSELAVESTLKEEALTEYLDAYYAVRKTEKEINKYYKDQITAGITEGGVQYREREIHKNYRAAYAFAQESYRSRMFVETYENCRIPFAENQQKAGTVRTRSEKYHAYQYLLEHLRSSISDANYTRYRRERLKKMKATPSLPASVLEKNRQKEEARLRLLENRITDFQSLMRMMEDGDFNPEAIEDRRLKKLYFHEIMPEAKALQSREAMRNYEAECRDAIQKADKKFHDDHSLELYNDQAEGKDEFSVPKDILEEFDKKEKKLQSARLFVANKERYDQELAARREEWKKEDKRNEAKKIGRALLNLSDLEQDELTKEERLQRDVVDLSGKYRMKKEGEGPSPKAVAADAAEREREKLFARARKNWEGKNEQQKKEYYFKLLGRKASKEKPDENGFYKEDVWNLNKEEEDLLLQYFSGETYWKIKENFDDKGYQILPENAPVFTEEQRKRPDEEKVQDLFAKMHAKMNFDENRAYPPEIKQYFEEHHDDREGYMDYRGNLYGRVKFNVERIVGKAKEFLAQKEEQIRNEQERLKRMKELEPEQKKAIQMQSARIGEFADKMENALAAYEKTDKKDKAAAGGKLITAADLLSAEQMKNDQMMYLKDNAQNMLQTLQGEVDKNMRRAAELERRLQAAFEKQYPVVIKDTTEQLKRLEDMIKNGAIEEADVFSKNMREKLDSLLFHDEKRQNVNREMEKKLNDLKGKIQSQRFVIEEEKRDKRQEKLKEIDDLYEGLTKEPEEELAEKDRLIGVNKEDRTLRKVSLLAQKCAAYIEFDSAKNEKYYNRNLFKRKEDAARVKDMMTELKKNYLETLGEKLLGESFSEVSKRGTEIQISRQKGKAYDPDMIEPDIRYRIKYARGYLALAGFGKKRETKEQEKKRSQVESRLHYLKDIVFLGEYTGTESEEEEEQRLSNLRRNYNEIMERKAALEEKLAKEFEKQQREELLKKNNQIADEFVTQNNVSSQASKLRNLREQEKEILSIHEKETQDYLNTLSAAKKEYGELQKQLREEGEKLIKVTMVYKGEAGLENKYKPGDPEILKAVNKQADKVKLLYKKREELWDMPVKKIRQLREYRRTISGIRKESEDIMGGIVVKKPEFFSTDPEKRMPTENAVIKELCDTRQILENDQMGKIIQMKGKRDAGEAVNYLLETKGAYLLDYADECVSSAKNGHVKAGEELRTKFYQFLSEIDQCSADLTDKEREQKTDPYRKKIQKKYLEIQLGFMDQKKAVSEKSIMEKIEKIPDDLVIDMETLTKIREITDERREQLELIKAEMIMRVPDEDEAYRPYEDYINKNHESPVMIALRKKIEAPLIRHAKALTEKASFAIQDLKGLKGDERTAKIKELSDILSETKACDKEIKMISEGVGLLGSRELLWKVEEQLDEALRVDEKKKQRQKKVGEMAEEEIFEMLDDIEKQDDFEEADLRDLELIKKTFEAYKKENKDLLSDPEGKKAIKEFDDRLKAVTEKAGQTVEAEKLRNNYRILCEEISVVISKSETLEDFDTKKIQGLMNSLNGYDRNKTYQMLLKNGFQEAKDVSEAIERDKARIEKRLALHKSDAAKTAEFAKMQKEWESASKKKVKGGDYEKVKKLDAQIKKYQTFLDSKEVLDLRAEKIGHVPERVNAAIKAISEETARIRCRLVDQTFDSIRKEADKVIDKKGQLTQDEMMVLAKALEQLNMLSLGETYKKLEEVFPNEGAIRLQTWDQYIEKVTKRFQQVA